MNVIAKQYIARTDNFINAIAQPKKLGVIAVYEDGKTARTYLENYIVSTRLVGDNVFMVTTEGGKREIEIVLI
jgi:hypothetical protein